MCCEIDEMQCARMNWWLRDLALGALVLAHYSGLNRFGRAG
jgi:hypothetical protein